MQKFEGKIVSPKCRGQRIPVMHKQSTLDQNHDCARRNRVIRYLYMEDVLDSKVEQEGLSYSW